jgi:hypothetical protein
MTAGYFVALGAIDGHLVGNPKFVAIFPHIGRTRIAECVEYDLLRGGDLFNDQRAVIAAIGLFKREQLVVPGA